MSTIERFHYYHREELYIHLKLDIYLWCVIIISMFSAGHCTKPHLFKQNTMKKLACTIALATYTDEQATVHKRTDKDL